MSMNARCPTAGSRYRWHLFATLLIVCSGGLRLAYLAVHCPLDLAPDEAHYWDWSRHLDWSYYSKGPLVAYAIRAATSLTGSWLDSWRVNPILAVRLPAVLCGCLLLVSLYVLVLQVFGRGPLALAVVAIALTMPVVAAGSTLMTIDSPYTCCWGWALVLAYQALSRGSSWAWPAAGIVVGLGILAKYTMVLWLLSFGLFLIATPAYRQTLRRPGFWIMTSVAALFCVPILVWNARHGWVSVRHVSGQAGLTDAEGVRWLGPVGFVGVQCALLLGFWFFIWIGAMFAYRPWHERRDGIRYLWWMSAPTFVFFLLFSLRSSEEPNWPITAYLSGLVLAAAWLTEQLGSPVVWYRRATVANLTAATILGLGLTLLIHHTDWIGPLLARLSGPATVENALPIRRFDPTCRLRGWPYLASEVDNLRTQLCSKGIEPVLAASSWTLPGELAFYCVGHPTVYTLGLALGDRHSQYDLWHPNPVYDSESFAGRTFIFVGDLHPLLNKCFRQVGEPQTVVYRENGEPIARWKVTVCRDFVGFPELPPWVALSSY